MALSWSGRRQILYYAVALVAAVLLLAITYNAFFNTAPSCFDKTQNGSEHGVDCGGGCSLVCTDESRAPVVLWSRAFEVAPHIYTAAAYVQNNNAGAGAKNVRYSFQLFDADNSLVIERQGVIDLPPVQTIPIIETGLDVGNRTVSRALFAFSDLPVWYKPRTIVPDLRVSGQSLERDGSRLSGTVTNDTFAAARATVAAVLFDAQGIARAASRSTLTVQGKSTQPVVFTWPGGTAGIMRAEITILPPF